MAVLLSERDDEFAESISMEESAELAELAVLAESAELAELAVLAELESFERFGEMDKSEVGSIASNGCC